MHSSASTRVLMKCMRSTVPVCSGCQLLRREGSSLRKRLLKQENIKDTVVKYASENTKQTERVYIWGNAITGALGISTFMRPEKRQLPRTMLCYPVRMAYWSRHKLKVNQVACGYGFTLFITTHGDSQRIYGSGVNTDSQLGYQEYPPNTGRILDYVIEPAHIHLPLNTPGSSKIHQVACGRAHTLILTDEGVFSLGNNAYGQCGRPVHHDELYRANPLMHKIKGLPDNITQVICGQDHSMFVTADGQVFACGLGADGQTGSGHYDVITVPQKVLGDVQGEKIVQVSSKADCVLAVSDKGDLFGWGNSEYNQLSMVTRESQVSVAKHLPLDEYMGKVTAVAAAGSMCSFLNDQGQVYVWGYGILGKGPSLENSSAPTALPDPLFGRNELTPQTKVTRLGAGMSHFAAVTDTGALYVWGNNNTGILGLGHKKNQFFPLKVTVPADVKDVICGVDHMAVLSKPFS